LRREGTEKEGRDEKGGGRERREEEGGELRREGRERMENLAPKVISKSRRL